MTPNNNDSESLKDRLKRTVDRAIPKIEIDETKILTDEEQEFLRRSFAERQQDRETAEKSTRQSLRNRLTKLVQKIEID